MIFLASGGQYSECSSDLGTYVWSGAIQAAQNYRGGGFSDWRLPDIGELNLIYENLHQNGLGGFSNVVYYWSSTETSAGSVWLKNLGSGGEYGGDKRNSYTVRAVRDF